MAKKKSQRPVTTRRMISLPTALDDRLKEYPDENWSAVACRAFEQRLGEISATKKVESMKDVIDRLRASKNQHDDESYQRGKDDGRKWAQNLAEAEELIRLERLREGMAGLAEWDEYFSDVEGSVYTNAEHLAMVILGMTECYDRSAADDFWSDLVAANEGDQGNNLYLKGFADGALEVWGEVKAHL